MSQNNEIHPIEYIWVDINGILRSKTRIAQYPTEWNFDGSSTGQAITENSEVVLIPKKEYFFNLDKNQTIQCNKTYLLCDVKYPKNQEPTDISMAELIFEKYNHKIPMFGLEQEFFMIDIKTGKPPGMTDISQQGQYYCGVGAENAFYREYLDKVQEICLDYGVKLTGMNYEVAPGQAEFQVCNIGMNACYDLQMLRYFLHLVGENYGIIIDYSPKPYKAFNGSGCHINFSTLEMRNINRQTDENKYQDLINQMFENLKVHHQVFVKDFYGVGNEARLIGKHETGSFDNFSVQYGGRGGSIRVSPKVNYFEDRRPAGNVSPFTGCSMLLAVAMGSDE